MNKTRKEADIEDEKQLITYRILGFTVPPKGFKLPTPDFIHKLDAIKVVDEHSTTRIIGHMDDINLLYEDGIPMEEICKRYNLTRYLLTKNLDYYRKKRGLTPRKCIVRLHTTKLTGKMEVIDKLRRNGGTPAYIAEKLGLNLRSVYRIYNTLKTSEEQNVNKDKTRTSSN